MMRKISPTHKQKLNHMILLQKACSGIETFSIPQRKSHRLKIWKQQISMSGFCVLRTKELNILDVHRCHGLANEQQLKIIPK